MSLKYRLLIYKSYSCLFPQSVPIALTLLVRISIMARCTTLCDKVFQWLATGWWFSPGPPVSSTNKTDCHDITEILLKVAWNTIKQTISFSILWKQLYNRNNFCLLICVLMPRTCLILPSAYIIVCHYFLSLCADS